VLTPLERGGFVTLAFVALAIAGCRARDEAARNTAPAAPTAQTATAAAPAVPKAAPSPACAPAPQLIPAQDFGDPRRAFAPGTAPFRRLEANFAMAYRTACDQGVLRSHSLVEPGTAERDRLRVKNAPDANVASIYLGGEEGAPRAQRHMLLEYPFLTADGATHVPTETELREAIFCAVRGATQQEEEEESGRCLAD
jgi:hypothetical protein